MPTSLRMRVVIERFVDVPDGYLYSQTHGNGPDVVLLNAGYADLRMWDSTLAWLAEIARVTTLDYRDTGLSSRAAEPYSELDDLAALLDAAGVESAVVVGVSDGARRGLAFAHRYPDRVRRVVAIGPALGGFPDPSPEETEARTPMRVLHPARGLPRRRARPTGQDAPGRAHPPDHRVGRRPRLQDQRAVGATDRPRSTRRHADSDPRRRPLPRCCRRRRSSNASSASCWSPRARRSRPRHAERGSAAGALPSGPSRPARPARTGL